MSLNSIVYTMKIYDGVTVASSGTSAYLPAGGIDYQSLKLAGNWTAQIVVTGTGTCSVGVLCSNDGVNFYKPSAKGTLTTPSYVATGLTANGGPDSNGKYFIKDPDVPLAGWVQFYIKETGASNSITVTMTIAFS